MIVSKMYSAKYRYGIHLASFEVERETEKTFFFSSYEDLIGHQYLKRSILKDRPGLFPTKKEAFSFLLKLASRKKETLLEQLKEAEKQIEEIEELLR